MRWMIATLAASMAVTTATALDEILLKNGRRYMGTILSDSPQSLIVSIDGGTVEFPRSAVVSPTFQGLVVAQAVEGKDAAPEMESVHPLPNISTSLRRLRRFDWASKVRQVPALVTDRGTWEYLPCIAFGADESVQVNFYGDPARPAGVEVSMLDAPETAWTLKKELLEFVLSLAPTLALDDRFDRLDVRRDSFVTGDLWLAVTSPDSRETPGRWTVSLKHERSVAASRATVEELQAISEPLKDATLDPNRPRSWQRGSWTLDEVAWLRRSTGVSVPVDDDDSPHSGAWTALGGERVFVRSFVRDRSGYARSSTDWLHEVAAGRTP